MKVLQGEGYPTNCRGAFQLHALLPLTKTRESAHLQALHASYHRLSIHMHELYQSSAGAAEGKCCMLGHRKVAAGGCGLFGAPGHISCFDRACEVWGHVMEEGGCTDCIWHRYGPPAKGDLGAGGCANVTSQRGPTCW